MSDEEKRLKAEAEAQEKADAERKKAEAKAEADKKKAEAKAEKKSQNTFVLAHELKKQYEGKSLPTNVSKALLSYAQKHTEPITIHGFKTSPNGAELTIVYATSKDTKKVTVKL